MIFYWLMELKIFFYFSDLIPFFVDFKKKVLSKDIFFHKKSNYSLPEEDPIFSYLFGSVLGSNLTSFVDSDSKKTYNFFPQEESCYIYNYLHSQTLQLDFKLDTETLSYDSNSMESYVLYKTLANTILSSKYNQRLNFSLLMLSSTWASYLKQNLKGLSFVIFANLSRKVFLFFQYSLWVIFEFMIFIIVLFNLDRRFFFFIS